MSSRYRLAAVVGILIAVASGAVTALLMSPRATQAPTPPAPQVLTLAASASGNTITVVGTGTASAVPDSGSLSLGVSATRSTVRDAVSQATADMNHLLGALHGQGVADKDIQTSWLSIYEQTNCCPQTVTAYTSSNQLTVTVHHLAGATAIIEASIDAVGNDLQLNGINLTLSDTTAINKSARAAAMSDANVRAQDWARLAGHHVGGLIGISELTYTPSGPVCDQCGGKGGGGGVPILAGQTSVTVTVTATYELLT
jgi:uncharacterized protein YggE